MKIPSRYLLAALLLAAALPRAAGAQGLAVGPRDVRIEARDDGGYDLYVRKTPDIASILLTESTKDPQMKADNFAYRAPEFNEVNGNEKRMLDGRALSPTSKLYSLISSTPVADPAFGQAFRILIPPVLVYGYPWSRSGSVAVGKGTFVNIRSFAKPYADYSGPFLDNPYQFALSTKPPVPKAPEPKAPAPMPIFSQEQPKKESAPPPPADDRTSSKIGEAIDSDPGKTLDLVVCLDTTESMDPYIEDLKKNLGPIIRARVAGFKSFRVGLVLYKDYWPDEYITRKYPFTSDIAAFERSLRGITVVGGKDIPEAVYEALVSAATEFDWQADRRQIILVGDAPPHPESRGKIGFDDVARETARGRIELGAIVEPSSIAPPNPPHLEFENEAKALAAISSGGAQVRLLALGRKAELEAGLLKTLPPDPRILSLGALAFDGSDEEALKAAAKAGASHLVLSRTKAIGAGGSGGGPAMSETVSRLLELPGGKELARDVDWRMRSLSGTGARPETEFVNGLRER
jgi:hypothetical protein